MIARCFLRRKRSVRQGSRDDEERNLMCFVLFFEARATQHHVAFQAREDRRKSSNYEWKTEEDAKEEGKLLVGLR